MAKRVLISGYIGFGNFGDEAIFACLVSYLKSRGADVYALSNTPYETSKRYSVKTFKYNSVSQIIKAVMSCEVLFSGGGSLLQNNTSNKSLIYYLLIILFAKLMGRKVIIFAQGFEGVKGKLMQKFTSQILNMCNLITVRDESSKSIMDKMKLQSHLVCDPVYSVKLPAYEPKDYVGIQLRANKNMHPLFLENLADQTGKFFKDKPIKIFSFQEKEDKNICIEFAMLLQRKFKDMDVEIVLNSSIDNIINRFKELEYLIAMRYHACILGTMYGIKTLPIAYDEKILSLSKESSIPYIRCDIEDDIKGKFKDLENTYYKTTRRFVWNIYDKFVQ